jgi:hypothetical protein
MDSVTTLTAPRPGVEGLSCKRSYREWRPIQNCMPCRMRPITHPSYTNMPDCLFKKRRTHRRCDTELSP